MLIRQAIPEDAQLLHDLILLAVIPQRQVDFDEIGWRRFLQPNSVDAIRERMDDESYLTLLAMQEDRVAGMITMHNQERIYQLFVHPAARKQGVARRLWLEAKYFCDRAGNTGRYRVRSSTMAVPVYESFGFRLSGDRRVDRGIVFFPLELDCRQ